jgi:hypothetical protein
MRRPQSTYLLTQYLRIFIASVVLAGRYSKSKECLPSVMLSAHRGHAAFVVTCARRHTFWGQRIQDRQIVLA